jgi:hypothetical protein
MFLISILKKCLVCYLIFSPFILMSDTIFYSNGKLLKGTIINQNVFDIYVKLEKGEILKINKDYLHKIQFEKNNETTEEIIQIPEKKEDVSIDPIKKISYSDPELKIEEYYELEQSTGNIFTIKINGKFLNSIESVYIQSESIDYFQTIYEFTDSSFVLKINADAYPIGSYDLIVITKEGKKIVSQHLLDILQSKN